MNARDNFEDVVSAITDRVCTEREANAIRGVFTPVTVIGVQIAAGLTRDQVRARIHEAARRTRFDVLDGLLQNDLQRNHEQQ